MTSSASNNHRHFPEAVVDATVTAGAADVNDYCYYRAVEKERLTGIKPELRIRLIFLDSGIAVIEKPSLLRSVPGHLHPLPLPSSNNHRTTYSATTDDSSRTTTATGIIQPVTKKSKKRLREDVRTNEEDLTASSTHATTSSTGTLHGTMAAVLLDLATMVQLRIA